MNVMDEMATKNFALSEVREMEQLSPYDRSTLAQVQ